MNRYRLAHVTEFHYDGIVSESYNVVRLRPRDDEAQTCLSFKLQSDPAAHASTYIDQWGNAVHTFNVLSRHRVLRIETHSLVHVTPPPPLPTERVSLAALDAMGDSLDEHFDFLAPTAYVPHPELLQEIVGEAERAGAGTQSGFVQAVASLIHDRFRYVKGATHVQSTVMDAVATGSGVCQDFAHVALAVVRMRGIPARYVSGYLVPSSATNDEPGAEDVIGGQASHAWIEAFLPGFGWFGLDPTLGESVGPRHVRVAYGRDYADAAPVRGVYKGHAGQQLFVDVGVRPALDDDGRELLEETAAAPRDLRPVESAPIQDQDQQQQQQQ
jgi:transglutaminase-like putative cysteine protease